MAMCSEIIAQIDIQLNNLLNSRAMFPHMKANMIGVTHCATAPFYQNRGFDIIFSFAEPLTTQRIDEINEIGHWINQNYVVRLCALLESYNVISRGRSINTQLDGHNEVDILRRLRNEFAHTSGWYDPTDPEEKRLREKIIEHFSLKADNHPETDGKFPIPIDKVLVPLTEGCKRYVRALLSCESSK